MSKIDLTGQKFERLAVVSRAENRGEKVCWNCICECGNEKIVQGTNLKSGATRSCGCLQIEKVREANTTHGHTKSGNRSPTYYSWRGMVQRCTNPNDKHYKNYMGRGITVCDRWLNFENFLKDMGEQPNDMSIDRINNEGNYCKENCRWGTIKEQNRNKRTNIWLIFNGETKIQADWAKEWSINTGTICHHLSKGRSMEWIYENKVKASV